MSLFFQIAAVPAPSLPPPEGTQPAKIEEPGRLEALRAEILRLVALRIVFFSFCKLLRREPVEPARSHKQLFLSDYVKKARKKDKKSTEAKLAFDGKEIWRVTEKKDKKKWLKMLEPQRQRYIEAYTVFVR